MKRNRVYQKPNAPPTVAKEIPVRSKGRFTGEKIVVAVDNPDYRPGTMDNVALGNLHHFPGVGMRGVREDRPGGARNNGLQNRAKSVKCRIFSGPNGKTSQVKGNAIAYATASAGRQTIMALRAKCIGPEDDFLGVAAREELARRLAERWEEMMA